MFKKKKCCNVKSVTIKIKKNNPDIVCCVLKRAAPKLILPIVPPESLPGPTYQSIIISDNRVVRRKQEVVQYRGKNKGKKQGVDVLFFSKAAYW